MPEVYAQAFELDTTERRAGSELFSEAVQAWIGYRWPKDQPWFSIREAASFRAHDGSIFRWEPYIVGDRCLIDFVWRHQDSEDATISWWSRVTFLEMPDDRHRVRRVFVRISNSSPEEEGRMPRLTTRPKLVHELVRRASWRCDGMPCTLEPQVLDRNTIPDFVRYELEDRERAYPAIILTPTRENSRFVVSPMRIAWEFMSLGSVSVVASAADTYALTDELGSKHLSCFDGGMRVYLPGFARDGDPLRHPLLVSWRLGNPKQRFALQQKLAFLTTKRFREGPESFALRDERAVAYADKYTRELADRESRASQAKEMHEWKELAEEYARDNKELGEQIRRLDEEGRELREKVSALQHNLIAARRRGAQGAREEDGLELFEPNSVLDAVEFAQDLFSDDLLILPYGLESAQDSPYRRPADVLRALKSLAGLAREMRVRPLGRPLASACKELGLNYASRIGENMPKRLRRQFEFLHDGTTYSCEEHIKLGVTYDPAECLRIYFTSRHHTTTGKFVVGHVGRHLEVPTTN